MKDWRIFFEFSGYVFWSILVFLILAFVVAVYISLGKERKEKK